jgi:hypothetical protein
MQADGFLFDIYGLYVCLVTDAVPFAPGICNEILTELLRERPELINAGREPTEQKRPVTPELTPNAGQTQISEFL